MPDGSLQLKKGKSKPPPEPGPRPATTPAAFRQPSSNGAPARTVLIDVRAVPGVEAFRKLQYLAVNTHGRNTVVLSTPDGTVRLPGTSGLCPEDHQAEVAVIIPGAVLRYDAASVDMAALGSGLVL
jgi:hypothetical protein